jgi:anti-sigma B factor antagonist
VGWRCRPRGGLRASRARDGETAWVQPLGELDLDSAHRVEAALEQVRGEGCRQLVLDLRGVTFMDSTGLRLVIRWDTAGQQDGFGFAVVPGQEIVQRVFRLTGMDSYVAVADPPPAAG